MSFRSASLLLLACLPATADEPKSKSVEELAAAVKPSVCVITTPGREARRAGLGTGFVISADGLIATNAHVIRQGQPITVEFADGTKYDAVSVQSHDHRTDLAIIKVDAKGLKPLPLGDARKLKDGQAVVAFGNPQGLKHSVVDGVVSAVREVEGRQMIQLAMFVEPGNSGGPVVDRFGRVVGVVSLKSLVTENLAFAATVNDLRPLMEKPNPVAMAAWVTIGALDPDLWKSEMGARWSQRAGRIQVAEPGTGFGGRSICIRQGAAPKVPFEVSVAVKLDDERGAAGLLFRHDGQRHYGFYPTGGKLRLTRFDGPDVYSWKILHDAGSPNYKTGEWNTLRVRVEKDRVKCFVNDQLVLESADAEWADGQVGLAKFRDTKAEFKQFRIGTDLGAVGQDRKPVLSVAEGAARPDRLAKLAGLKNSTDVLRDRAKELEQQAAALKALAGQVHRHRVMGDLVRALEGPEDRVDLIHAALLLAKLDNEELDVDAYRGTVERMAKAVSASLPKDANDEAKLKALHTYFFENRGFHGSRQDYYTKSNSYLNEVLDDREGLPITLSVLYMELARRIGLPIVGIGLPGHFVVRHAPVKGEGQFIDVFERGKAMTAAEAKAMLVGYVTGEVRDEMLKPVTKKAIVVRMLANLLGIARREQDLDAGLRYLDCTLALDPGAGQSRMMRVGIYLAKGMKAEAVADVDYLLDNPTEGVDRRQLTDFRRQLERDR